eukprot:RCo005561
MSQRHSPEDIITASGLPEPPRLDRRLSGVDHFIDRSAFRFDLNTRSLLDIHSFCPIRTTTVIIDWLQQVTQSLPMLRLRVKTLVARTRRIQTWFRRTLKARNGIIQQIFESWVASNAIEKKTLQTELYRDQKLKLFPETFRARLQSYSVLHTADEALSAAVVTLYWERRKAFTQKFHGWYAKLCAAQQEQ